jgi:glycosyltransferase involved in cell wall biosynthesis
MKVSIVTVSYNAVSTIEQTIQSVLNQNYDNIEYVVIDGQSTDGTREIIEKYKDRLDYYVSEPDNGIYDAMNKGVKIATGDIIAFLNADDWYEKDVVSAVSQKFIYSDADIVYGDTNIIDKNGKKSISRKRTVENIWKNIIACHQSIFVKRNLFFKIGMFDLSYEIAADYDWLLRAYIYGARFAEIDTVISNYRIGGFSSLNSLKYTKEYVAIALSHIDGYGDKDELYEFQKKRLHEKIFELNFKSQPYYLAERLKLELKSPIKNITIWGSGMWGQLCFEQLSFSDVKIESFVDSDEVKQGTLFNGIEICNPDSLRERNEYVLVAIRNHDEEIEQCLSRYRNGARYWTTIETLVNKTELDDDSERILEGFIKQRK